MKNAKKVLALLLCALLLIGASVAGTLAYLTDSKNVTNTFTVGNVKIELDEAVVDKETGKPLKSETDADGNVISEVVDTVAEADRTKDGNTDVLLIPGRTTVKDPTITVLKGSEDCYVRAKVTVTIPAWTDAAARAAGLIVGTGPDDDDRTVDIYDFATWAKECFANDFITSGEAWSGFNTQYWHASTPEVDVGNETFTYYLTYNKYGTDNIVPKDTTSDKTLEPLFIGVTVPTSMTNDQLALLAGMTIDVEAQAIQAEGFTATGTEGQDGYMTAEKNAWSAFDKQMTPSTEETP